MDSQARTSGQLDEKTLGTEGSNLTELEPSHFYFVGSALIILYNQIG